MTNRVTPENITELKENEVFVFGANMNFIHGAGAAKIALIKWGAIMGRGGLQGQTYALPTKDEKIKTLPTSVINLFVQDFIYFAQDNPHLTFLVTEVGCGLAGLTPEQIAPMFEYAKGIPNIHLPKRFWDIIGLPVASIGDQVFLTENTRVMLSIEDGTIFTIVKMSNVSFDEEYPIILTSPEYSKVVVNLNEIIKIKPEE